MGKYPNCDCNKAKIKASDLAVFDDGKFFTGSSRPVGVGWSCARW